MSDFKGRRFPIGLILLCVRWYCKFGISYRDLEDMMSERGMMVDHTTLFRWYSATRRSWKNASAGISAARMRRGGEIWAKVGDGVMR